MVMMMIIVEEVINSRKGNGGLGRVAGKGTQILNTVYLYMSSQH